MFSQKNCTGPVQLLNCIGSLCKTFIVFIGIILTVLLPVSAEVKTNLQFICCPFCCPCQRRLRLTVQFMFCLFCCPCQRRLRLTVQFMFCLQIEQFTSHILQSEKTAETPRLSPEELVYANEYVYFFWPNFLWPRVYQS